MMQTKRPPFSYYGVKQLMANFDQAVTLQKYLKSIQKQKEGRGFDYELQ